MTPYLVDHPTKYKAIIFSNTNNDKNKLKNRERTIKRKGQKPWKVPLQKKRNRKDPNERKGFSKEKDRQ